MSATKNATTVNKRALAEILGIAEVTLTEWQIQGMPIAVLAAKRGESNGYEPAKVIRWWIAREVAKVSTETPRDRLARVQAERIEMEMATMRGELIHAKDINAVWAGLVVACRQEFLSIPSNISHQLAQLDGPEPMHDLLLESIEDALKKLAEDDEPSVADPDPDDEGPLAPAADVAPDSLGRSKPRNAARVG